MISVVVPKSAPLIKRFSNEMRCRLVDLGWRKRAGDLYTIDRGDFVGWLGVGRATKNGLSVGANIGVRHQPLEHVISNLTGRAPHAYLPPTISTSIGYLREGGREWFEVAVTGDADAVSAADAILSLIEEYGLTYLDRHCDLANLEEALASAGRDTADYRLPVLSTMLGRGDSGQRRLDEALRRREGRTDAEVETFRLFASEFERWRSDLMGANG